MTQLWSVIDPCDLAAIKYGYGTFGSDAASEARELAASLDPYAAPAIVERVVVFGGYRAVDRLQAGLVGEVMNGPNVAQLESQRRRDPQAYSWLDLGRDVTAAVWGDLEAAPPARRALQRGYLDAAQKMLGAWAKGSVAEAAEEAQAKLLIEAAERIPPAAARALVETGDDAVFVPWLYAQLPGLKARLEAAARTAASEADRLHFADMAAQMARLTKLAAP